MAVGVRRRRGAPAAIQEPLFDVQLRPERRYFRQILRIFSEFAFDPLRAEVALSKVLGVIWASSPDRDGGAEEVFGLGLADYARQTPHPTSVGLLRALASVGTVPEVREAAAAALDVLVASGLPAGSWPTLFRGQCWAHEDDFGDLTTVICEFGYGSTWPDSDRHGLVVHVDHVAFHAATSVRVSDDVPNLLLELPSSGLHGLRQVEPGWAGAVLDRAFARTDMVAYVSPDLQEMRALGMARVRSLPSSLDQLPTPVAPSLERRSAIVDEFLARTSPAHADVARHIVEFAALHDPGDLTRVSPGRWESFLYEYLPSTGPLPPVDDVAAAVRAWSSWAASYAGLSGAARAELSRQLDELLSTLA